MFDDFERDLFRVYDSPCGDLKWRADGDLTVGRWSIGWPGGNAGGGSPWNGTDDRYCWLDESASQQRYTLISKPAWAQADGWVEAYSLSAHSPTWNTGPIFRVADYNNHLMVQWLFDGTIRLNKVIAGTVTQITSASGAPTSYTSPHTIRVEFSGTTVVVKMDGTTYITYTGSEVENAAFGEDWGLWQWIGGNNDGADWGYVDAPFDNPCRQTGWRVGALGFG